MEKARCALPFTSGFFKMVAEFLANDQTRFGNRLQAATFQ
jgi:hypothetical protein